MAALSQRRLINLPNGTTISSDIEVDPVNGNFDSFGVNVNLPTQGGVYTSAQLGNSYAPLRPPTGAATGNYNIGVMPQAGSAVSDIWAAYDKANGRVTGPYTAENGNKYDTRVDDWLIQVGRDLNYYASSPGSPNANAREWGIQKTNEFYTEFGTEWTKYTDNTLSTMVQQSATRTDWNGFGAQPADWNTDDEGKPLPWGTRRQRDGRVTYQSGGGAHKWDGLSTASATNVNSYGIKEQYLFTPAAAPKGSYSSKWYSQ